MPDPNIDPYLTLSKDVNKVHNKDNEDREGVISAVLPEVELPISDEDLLKVTKKWQQQWDSSEAKSQWLKACEENRNYWLGKHYNKPSDGEEGRAMVDNLIFEALESFLPQATRRNPEPMVTSDVEKEEDPVKKQFIERIKSRLAYLADVLKLRLKIKKSARHWAIYLLGVAKIGWSGDENDIALKSINPKKLILDADATIDEDGYHGRFIGELRKMEASILVKLAPKKEKEIKELVKDDMGTEVQFTEWNTQEYICWTLGEHVLIKDKNPNWNYDSEEDQVEMDDYGVETSKMVTNKGINHFSVPKIPYVFLTIFNLGEKPMDDTSLIGQNLANQDIINKRNKQIDRNADNQNGGMVVSMERSGLTKEQAKGVTDALRKGGTVMIPTGAPKEAIDRFSGNNLPSDIFNDLNDKRARTRDIFGIRGSTPAGIGNEDTVRGKLIVKNLDGDRIGGGITEYLEQYADDIYNWFVQMMYVHYPEVRELFETGFEPPKLTVSVKEGSLLPKDSTTLANQAIELANAGKMALIDLYERLEYPNPEQLAANVWLEANAPELLYGNVPMVQQVMQIKMQQQAMMAEQQQQQAVQQQNSKVMESDQKFQQNRVLNQEKSALKQQPIPK